MTTYLVDAYAWVEYFQGNKKAEAFQKLLSYTSNQFFTVESNLAEIRMWAIRAKRDFDELYKIIQTNSSLSPVHLHDWLEAAAIREEMRKTRDHFGLIDSILLVKQKELRSKIISGDPHFKDLPGVIFLK